MSRTPITLGTQTIEAMKKACTSFTTVEYSPKTAVLTQGRLADTVFWIASGLVKLTHVDSSGKEIIVGIRRSGWVLGVAAAILHQPEPTGAETLTHCQLRQIPAGSIRDFINSQSMFCRYLHELQAQEVQDHLLNVVELASHSTEYRLARLLSELPLSTELSSSSAQPNSQIPLKQWEIAALLGVTPEHLCRVIRRLERQGVLLRKRRQLSVADADKLSHSCDL